MVKRLISFAGRCGWGQESVKKSQRDVFLLGIEKKFQPMCRGEVEREGQ